ETRSLARLRSVAGRQTFGENLLQLPCEISRLALPDRLAVEGDDRHHVGRRAGEKQLAQSRDLLHTDRSFVQLDVHLARQIAQHRARDSRQDVVVARVCSESTVDDSEEVGLGAFSYYPVANEHRLECSLLLGDLGSENIGQQVESLQVAATPALVGQRNRNRSR